MIPTKIINANFRKKDKNHIIVIFFNEIPTVWWLIFLIFISLFEFLKSDGKSTELNLSFGNLVSFRTAKNV